MTRIFVFLLAVAPLCSPASAQARLQVVTTLPDFAAIARVIGGDQIHVTALARGTEDAHFVDARPSFIRVLNQADVLVEGGMELEIGWLPVLLQNARNPRIQPGQEGLVDASKGIQALEVPTGSVDRSQGDVHAKGNPHFWLDPVNGATVAQTLAEVFSKKDPAHAATYQTNLSQFRAQLDVRLAKWMETMQPYRGTKVVTYHKTYDYLARRFGLEVVDQLEPKPGIEPSPSHVAALIPRAKQAEVKLVLIEPFRPRKTPAYVAEAIGAKLVILPDKVEGNPSIKDYLGLFDYVVNELARALKPAP